MSASSSKLPFNPPPANGLAPQSTQPRLVCTWSARAPQSESSPFPRSGHTLTATATATPVGELFLFGGYVNGRASSDLYVFSTRDLSTTLLQTSGEVPVPRAGHGAALIGTTLLICGGKTDVGYQYVLKHDSLYFLNLVSREWTRVVVNGPGPGGRYYHTTNMVGSKFFVFGGQIDRNFLNDIWALDLNSLKSQPHWESYEPIPGNKKPHPRTRHVSVTTENRNRIIIFGGCSDLHHYNDTWSFDISTRKWTELQCTGSIPSPRASHAAVLVDDVMYVFGGVSVDEGHLDDLHALQLSTRRWFKLHNVGPSPHGRSAHTMASDGTRVFVLGGYSNGARPDEISDIHGFDTKDINYPEPERNAVNLNEKITQPARKSSTGPATQEQSQRPKSSSSETHRAFRLQNAPPAISGRSASLHIPQERNPGANRRVSLPMGVNSKPTRVPEGDISEGSTGYHTKFAAPRSPSEGEVARLELERQLSVLLAAQAERDQRIARLADELALKSALLEQAEANAEEGKRRARLELREHDDRLLMQTSLVEQRDAELVDMQARLGGLVVSHHQQIGRYEQELANMRAELEAKDSELETVQLRLSDAEEGLTEKIAEVDTLRALTATGSVIGVEGQVTRWLMERMRAIEVKLETKQGNEKSIVEEKDRNEE